MPCCSICEICGAQISVSFYESHLKQCHDIVEENGKLNIGKIPSENHQLMLKLLSKEQNNDKKPLCKNTINNQKLIEEYPIQDDIWTSRRWNKERTNYVDLSGECSEICSDCKGESE